MIFHVKAHSVSIYNALKLKKITFVQTIFFNKK